MNEDRLKTLFQSWLDGTATSAERDEFLWMMSDPAVKVWVQGRIGEELERDPALIERMPEGLSARMPEGATARMLETIFREDARVFGGDEEEPARVRKKSFLWLRTAAAAAVLVPVLIWGVLKYRQGSKALPAAPQQTIAMAPDVQPGGDKAMLTLSDGSSITLDSAADGTLARQGRTQIVKTGSGQLSYGGNPGDRGNDARGNDAHGNDAHGNDAHGNDSGGHGNDHSAAVSYNSLSTARGGQYRLVLPDGSKVWLNAASAIRFPTAFTGSDRTVELIKGEAYFEVVKDAVRPFAVKIAGGGQVQVLGTSFNVNAYEDEDQVRTTLLDGSVQFRAGGNQRILQPGEQSRIGRGQEAISVAVVNTRQVTAWKDGYFRFEKTDLRTIMRQLSRWYDIEVKYAGNVPNDTFDGVIRRDKPLSGALKMLEYGDIHYKLAGKVLTID